MSYLRPMFIVLDPKNSAPFNTPKAAEKLPLMYCLFTRTQK